MFLYSTQSTHYLPTIHEGPPAAHRQIERKVAQWRQWRGSDHGLDVGFHGQGEHRFGIWEDEDTPKKKQGSDVTLIHKIY
jgi:hypothetical protein